MSSEKKIHKIDVSEFNVANLEIPSEYIEYKKKKDPDTKYGDNQHTFFPTYTYVPENKKTGEKAVKGSLNVLIKDIEFKLGGIPKEDEQYNKSDENIDHIWVPLDTVGGTGGVQLKKLLLEPIDKEFKKQITQKNKNLVHFVNGTV